MNARENALRIVRFDRPERVVQGPPRHDVSYFGVNHEPFEGVGGHQSPVGTQWRDIWGVGWKKALDGVMGYIVEHPLCDLADVDRYRFPDPDDPRLVDQVYARARSADREKAFLAGANRDTLWERAYELAGMEGVMLGMIEAPEAVRRLLHRIMDFQLGVARHYVAAGIEWAGLGDDLGSQRGPLMSREMLVEFLVPEYRRLFAFYKQHGVLINFHSCGCIEPILDVFMNLGVDVLNPIQATANNLNHVRKVTRGRMALQGGVSTKTIMAGPPERIRDEVRRRLWQLGRDGGYFCAPDQGMPFPADHLRAFEDALAEFGTYPLIPPEDASETPSGKSLTEE
jgi:uroporphyrinogen decarboxylase